MAKVVIGVDPRKRINAVVVVSAKGKVLARAQFENSAGGFRELRMFSPVEAAYLGRRGLQRRGQALGPAAGGRGRAGR